MNKSLLFLLLLTGCTCVGLAQEEDVRFTEVYAVPGSTWALGSGSSRLFAGDIVRARVFQYTKAPDSVLLSLSLRQQFVYHMIHPEVYSQMCGLARRPVDKSRIYARLGETRDEWKWSSRQRQFLTDHRDSVISWMRTIMREDSTATNNVKDAILLVNGIEMIPEIISWYRKTGDNDILTVLALLLQQNKDIPFRLTPVYGELYGDDKSYRTFIPWTPGNERMIIGQSKVFASVHGYEFDEPAEVIPRRDTVRMELPVIWGDRSKPGKSGLNGLTLRQQFAYHMANPEVWSQTCSLDFRPYETTVVYGELKDPFFEKKWADRQRKFFLDHRDSVIHWCRSILAREGVVADNIKEVLSLVDAREMIPPLVEVYGKTRDHYILTLLLLLMKRNVYPPFVRSDLFTELYGEDASRKSFILYTPENERLIIRLATDFYQGVGYVLVPKGRYLVGKKGEPRNPLRTVSVDSFRIAVYETTNCEFAAFVTATSYVTDAERQHDAMVFQPGLEEFQWIEDSTACWLYPNGISRGGIADKMDHPVTCISYTDIQAYCAWAKVRLPTLDEWEIACRAGTTTDHFFGDDLSRIGEYANIWQGRDHMKADLSDGYLYTSPVGRFKPNPWGLYDMYGNVFEFCTGQVSPLESKTIAHARGGSWWCSTHSCQYFNSYDIGLVNIHASFSNQGFRVVSGSFQ